MYVYVYIYVYIYIYISTCMYSCVYVCTYVCMYVFTKHLFFMHFLMYLCMYMHRWSFHVYAYHARIGTYIHTHYRTYIRTLVSFHAHAPTSDLYVHQLDSYLHMYAHRAAPNVHCRLDQVHVCWRLFRWLSNALVDLPGPVQFLIWWRERECHTQSVYVEWCEMLTHTVYEYVYVK